MICHINFFNINFVIKHFIKTNKYYFIYIFLLFKIVNLFKIFKKNKSLISK